MAVRRNAFAPLRTSTQQPVRVPGRVLLRLGALAGNSSEMMSVTYSIRQPSGIQFDTASGPQDTVAVCDGAHGSGNVRPCSGGDSVQVQDGERDVVFDARLVRKAGGALPAVIEVAVEVEQGGVFRFSDAMQLAVTSGVGGAVSTAAFGMTAPVLPGFATTPIPLARGAAMLLVGDAATIRAIVMETLRQLPEAGNGAGDGATVKSARTGGPRKTAKKRRGNS